MRVTVTPAECKLICSAFDYLTGELEKIEGSHGTLTRWARKEVREQLAELKTKFEITK
jgi:hypothetical protein